MLPRVRPAALRLRRSVQRAADAHGTAVEDVGVNHGGADVAVAEELLDRADVVAGLEQVRGEAVAESVAGGSFCEARGLHRVAERALEDRLVEVVAAVLTGLRVAIGARRREDPLPGPLPGGVGELDPEGAREIDVARAVNHHAVLTPSVPSDRRGTSAA